MARATLVVKEGEEDALEAALRRLTRTAADAGVDVVSAERPLARAVWVDLAVDELSCARALMAEAAAELPVDFAVARRVSEPVRLLISDMDSTLIAAECIDELAALAGVGEKVRLVTERAMRGELDFAAALRARVALLKGLPASALAEVADSRAPLRPGAKTLFATLARAGVFTVIVSGGFGPIVQRIADRLGAHAWHANELEIAGGRLTGRLEGAILDAARKAALLEDYGRSRGAPRTAQAGLGDGANDLPMLKTAGLAIGVHPKPVVAEMAHGLVRHTDLTSVLLYCGIPPQSWIEAG